MTMTETLLIVFLLVSLIQVNSQWVPEKDVTTSLAQQQQEELEKSKDVDSGSIVVGFADDKFVSMANSCPPQTISKRNGPIFVAFNLPQSNFGTQVSFEAGRAYRHVMKEDKCYSLSWSDYFFECDGATGKFKTLNGTWPTLANDPSDCVSGGGSTRNHEQPNLEVTNSMALTCASRKIDVHNSPIHVRFDLPDGGSISSQVSFSAGNAGRRIGEGSCLQIEWSQLVFTCDPVSVAWKYTSGTWTTKELLDCASWQPDSTQTSNTDQEFLQVLDSTGSPPCQGVEFQQENGPLQVRIQLPSDFSLGSLLSYKAGEMYRWHDEKCFILQWTDHEYMCDIFSGKWLQRSGSFLMPDLTPLRCNGVSGGNILNGDQPYLQTLDLTQTDAPTGTPGAPTDPPVVTEIPPILSQNPTKRPTFAPVSTDRPLETGVPLQPALSPVLVRPTPAPFSGLIPMETAPPLLPLPTPIPTNVRNMSPSPTTTAADSKPATPNPALRPTMPPSPKPTTSSPTSKEPTLSPTTPPTPKPTTSSPTSKEPTMPPTAPPSPKPTTANPTSKEPTMPPTTVEKAAIPASPKPIVSPPIPAPTSLPTSNPSARLKFAFPTRDPSIGRPTPTPTPAPSSAKLQFPFPTPDPSAGRPTPIPTPAPSTGRPTTLPPTTPFVIPATTPKPTLRPSAPPSPRPTTASPSSKEPTMPPTTTTTAAIPATPKPTIIPTRQPSAMPTSSPTARPTTRPTPLPTSKPSVAFRFPTNGPTQNPVIAPTASREVYILPTSTSNSPISTPPVAMITPNPTPMPTANPTRRPSTQPSNFDIVEQVPIAPTTTTDSPSPNPTEAPASAPTTEPSSTTPPTIVPFHCGCPLCTDSYWSKDALGFSCGERIEYIVEVGGGTLLDACRQVAGEEFPDLCGPRCDPDKCEDLTIVNEKPGLSSGLVVTNNPSQAPSAPATLTLVSDAATPNPNPNLRVESGGSEVHKAACWLGLFNLILALGLSCF